jgi:hypothetical protein
MQFRKKWLNQLKNFFNKHFKEYYLATFCYWIPSSCENHCNLTDMPLLGLKCHDRTCRWVLKGACSWYRFRRDYSKPLSSGCLYMHEVQDRLCNTVMVIIHMGNWHDLHREETAGQRCAWHISACISDIHTARISMFSMLWHSTWLRFACRGGFIY